MIASTVEPAASRPLLRVSDLEVQFHSRDGVTQAVNGVSFEVHKGQTLAIVGESGCGKSVTSLSVLRLLSTPPAKITKGSLVFSGADLFAKSEREMQAIRGNRISMIFQEPMTSLNPIMTIGAQLGEPLVKHLGLSRADARRRAVELLRAVHVASPEQRVHEYPYQLSGGMRQRVMIAMALGCRPELLIADEPTTALDVTIQAQILELLRELQARDGTAIILITHDLGVVASMAQRVMVMYAGRTVEEGSVADIFKRPLHPYTRGLLEAIPRRQPVGSGRATRRRLADIPGVVPSLREPLSGCAFAARCRMASSLCRSDEPAFREWEGGHRVACHYADKA